MNVVDSSGWLEYFADTPNADFFTAAIVNTDELIVPAICLFEVFKRILLQRDEDAALQAIFAMQEGRVTELDATIAIHAAKLSATLKIPMADSIIFATAKAYHAMVWTQDADFEGLEGIQYIKIE
jgi:predicted nucleic acid-binding protein